MPMPNRALEPGPPTIRRLACCHLCDTLECSYDHSAVRYDADGDAACAYGHRWPATAKEQER